MRSRIRRRSRRRTQAFITPGPAPSREPPHRATAPGAGPGTLTDPARQLARARLLGHRPTGFSVGGSRPVQRKLNVGGKVFQAGSILEHIPENTDNFPLVVNILTALAKSPLLAPFDSWEIAINCCSDHVDDILNLEEDFESKLSEGNLDGYHITAIHAAIFGFDDESATAFLRIFFKKGLWYKNVKWQVGEANLEAETPYVTTRFVFGSGPKKFGQTDTYCVGLNAHLNEYGDPIAGSCWIQGYYKFGLDHQEIPELDEVINILCLESNRLRGMVDKLKKNRKETLEDFGEKLRQARFGPSKSEKKTNTNL